MNLDEFSSIVEEAIQRLPQKVLDNLSDVTIDVEDEASAEMLIQMNTSHTPFGVYQRICKAWKDGSLAHTPGRIIIYRVPFDIRYKDRETLVVEVLKTIKHEVMHHFGYGEKEAKEAELWSL